MTALANQMTILSSLESRCSRASAAAIGHQFVLSGNPPQVQVRGIDALAAMPCDWSIGILEEVVNDPLRNCLVRQYTIRHLAKSLNQAVDRGYGRICRAGVNRLADLAVSASFAPGGCQENRPAEDLCSHLLEAVNAGFLGQIPDF
jgi:hypothetical protein